MTDNDNPAESITGRVMGQLKTDLEEAGVTKFMIVVDDPDTHEGYFIKRDACWTTGVMLRHMVDQLVEWAYDSFKSATSEDEDEGDGWKDGR